MKRLSLIGASALCISTGLAYPEQSSLRRQDNAAARAQAVKDVFKFSWQGYYEHAFPADELHPVSNTPGNSRNGWGASAVDALTTALVMEESEIVDQILTHIATIDYSKTDSVVSLFETTIRYLGGMLSGYDFLKGPLSNLQVNKSNVDTLLTQSKNLADQLKFAFDTPTTIPHNELWFNNKTYEADDNANGLATIGTLVMEWTRLSDLLKDDQYASLTQKAEEYLLKPQPASSEPFPGLVGSSINITSGQFENNSGGWGGGTDSFYEYLIKMYVYDPVKFASYKDRWVAAADSTIRNLTSHPSSKPGLTFVAGYSGTRLSLSSGHLACFIGGNFILGGLVLGSQNYTDYGLALTDGCHQTYNSTVTRIGPEGFGWDASKVPADQKDFYNKNGFYINTAYYDLRPEVIESYYYAYRATGDSKYQDWAWDAFKAINATCRTDTGFTAVQNVNTQGGGGNFDNQESFWFAEVMKYSYLIHAEDAAWQVAGPGKQNTFVYNTEAHPFLIRNPPSSTSSSGAGSSTGNSNGNGAQGNAGRSAAGRVSRNPLL